MCDTQQQVERFVALYDGDAAETVSTVNAEEHNENACGVVTTAFVPGPALATVVRSIPQLDEKRRPAATASSAPRIVRLATREDVAARLKGWSQPEPNYRKGVLARYGLLVGSASEGAILKP